MQVYHFLQVSGYYQQIKRSPVLNKNLFSFGSLRQDSKDANTDFNSSFIENYEKNKERCKRREDIQV